MDLPILLIYFSTILSPESSSASQNKISPQYPCGYCYHADKSKQIGQLSKKSGKKTERNEKEQSFRSFGQSGEIKKTFIGVVDTRKSTLFGHNGKSQKTASRPDKSKKRAVAARPFLTGSARAKPKTTEE